MNLRPGPLNAITDVDGLVVGNAASIEVKTGVTVVSSDVPFTASVNVMGGAPGTRETDLLAPDKLVDEIDALVLAGGSAFGLDAASGVCAALDESGRGFRVGPVSVPIVPAAIIFDLLAGGDTLDYASKHRDLYRDLGYSAALNCAREFDLGSIGAGTGATTANVKGGLGSASLVLDSGYSVGALVVVNPFGSAVCSSTGRFWAAPYEIDNEFGGAGSVQAGAALALPINAKLDAFNAKANTTIAIIATDAELTKAQLQRMAVSAQDGMARALVPAHTPYDGDLIFSVSTKEKKLKDDVQLPLLLGHTAAVCLARAIARAVFLATPAEGDLLPCWTQRWIND